ncbi:MAG: hypothetical protein KJZ62_01670 [Fimbriimonadaceae bacterium]|nr:hypothetical protein [Fimbriimonadaceae bacterium]QOJ11526.1 MAG: hypothetical protein HRU74_05465 [Chthonomonadaceae bacterium]
MLVVATVAIAAFPTWVPFVGTIQAFCEDLTLRSGTSYRASAELRNRVIIVSNVAKPTAASLEEAEAVASYVGAEWVADGDTLVLEQSTESLKESIAYERDLRAEAIRGRVNGRKTWAPDVALAMLSNQLAELRSNLGNPDATSALRGYTPRLPADGLLDEFIAIVGPDALARIPPGTTVSFSSHPTGHQRPIGLRAQSALRSYSQVMSMAKEWLAADSIPTTAYARPWREFFDRIQSPPSEPVAILTVMPMWEDITLRLRIYDRGSLIDEASVDLPVRAPPAIMPGILERAAPGVRMLSQPARDMVTQLLKAAENIAAQASNPEPLPLPIAEPTIEDPVATVFQDIAHWVSATTNRLVVAWLPDQAMDDLILSTNETPQNVVRILVSKGIIGFRVTERRVLITPQRQNLAHALFLDRSSLATFISRLPARDPKIEWDFLFGAGPGSTQGSLQRYLRYLLYRNCLISHPTSQVSYYLGSFLSTVPAATWRALERLGSASVPMSVSSASSANLLKWVAAGRGGDPSDEACDRKDVTVELRMSTELVIKCAEPDAESLLSGYPVLWTTLAGVAATLKGSQLHTDIGAALRGKYLLGKQRYLQCIAFVNGRRLQEASLPLSIEHLDRAVPYGSWPEEYLRSLREHLKG